jgi:hypothetical protein
MPSSTASSFNPPQPVLIRDPATHLWRLAVAIAARQKFKFSSECAANLKEQIKAGLKDQKVGLYEFRDRAAEAEANIEKLLQLMITEEQSRNPSSQLLGEAALFSALYGRKLCPGLWPLC